MLCGSEDPPEVDFVKQKLLRCRIWVKTLFQNVGDIFVRFIVQWTEHKACAANVKHVIAALDCQSVA